MASIAQRNKIQKVHTRYEILGLTIAGPVMLFAAAQNKKLSPTVRSALAVGGVTTMIVDGWLLKKRLK